MDQEEKRAIVGELFEQFQELHEKYIRFWVEHTFLHWQWWLSLGLSISSWTFWIYYHNKKSTQRLLHAGFFAILTSICFDYIGAASGLWYYTGKLTPTFPAWLPFNTCLMPVTIMFLIQTKPYIATWKKGLFFGLLTSFVGEPLFVWAGYYVLTGWQYYYSVPIYFLIYVCCDWLTKRDTYEALAK